MGQKIAALKGLKDGRIRISATIIPAFELWDLILKEKGYERNDDIVPTGFFSKYRYKVHYKKIIK